MPHVLPNDQEKLAPYKTIESKSSLLVGYLMIQCDSISVPQTGNFTWRLSVKSAPEKPRWIIVAFQTDTSGNQEHNPSIFDHCNLTNMFVILSSRRYPKIDYDDTNFIQHKFKGLWRCRGVPNKVLQCWRVYFFSKYNPGRLQGIFPNVCLW